MGSAIPKPGRTGFITGASTDIGYAIACRLACAGYDAVTGRDLASVEALLRDPAVQGRKILPLRLDLRVKTDFVQAFKAAVATLGAIDALVNHAARSLQQPAIDAASVEWDAASPSISKVLIFSRGSSRLIAPQPDGPAA